LPKQAVQDAIQRKVLLYDKSGEEHYNLISALHKSVRSSDADAALYWLARMLEAGEDRLYIARRLMRMAIEDIGLADPRALEQCRRRMQAVHFLGIGEGDLALAQAAIYLSVAPKSDAAYRALAPCRRTCRRPWRNPSPCICAMPPPAAMKQWGYSAGYEHAHKFEDAITGMECLPPSLAGKRYYHPTDRGRRSASASGWKRCARLCPAWTSTNSRLPKGHLGRESERQLARNVHLCREGRRSRRLRGLPLR
jgi:putative ATPase